MEEEACRSPVGNEHLNKQLFVDMTTTD